MSSSYDRWGSPAYQDPDKVIEIKQVRTKLPFTVIELGDRAALLRCREEWKAAVAAQAVRAAARYERSKAIMQSWIEEQNAPIDARTCECGAESCGSAGHSSWCPVYKLTFERHKTSQTSWGNG